MAEFHLIRIRFVHESEIIVVILSKSSGYVSYYSIVDCYFCFFGRICNQSVCGECKILR